MVQKVPCRLCHAEILPDTAARTDGICMRCARASAPEPTNIVEQARTNPARCLQSYRVTLDPSLERRTWDNIGIARFVVSCQCGEANLGILGYPHNPDADSPDAVFLAPLSLACESCKQVRPLFDPRRDGYDAEIESPTGMTGDGQPTEFACAECGARAFLPVVAFQYSLEDEEMEDWEELAKRPGDFFDWFSLSATCSACGIVNEVTDYECA